MKLSELFSGIQVADSKNTSVEIKGLSLDSRTCEMGDLFFALKGSQSDGTQFINDAIEKNVSALVVSPSTDVPEKFRGGVIVLADPRAAVPLIAKKFYGDPSQSLFLAGVTGTNGKTSTTYLLEAIMGSGIIGTIDNHFKKEILPTINTTPDVITANKTLSQFLKWGAKSVAMEVTSHALIQGRVEGLEFDCGVFTNLTRDHLDFHKTMDEYANAKSVLFQKLLKNSSKKKKRAIVNGEDPEHKKMIVEGLPHWTFGIDSGDIHVEKLSFTFDKTEFVAATPLGKFKGVMGLIGRHNVLNALGALGVAFHYGLNLGETSRGLARMEFVPGRLQRVQGAKVPIHAYVDYAHTDDGLDKALRFLNEMRQQIKSKAKIITVFGCGGDRDRGKRPLMMETALKWSDKVVVTSDNPRTEDPQAIIRDILNGKAIGGKIAMDADRRAAIQLALGEAKSGDIVLIAGKGHENYQIIGTKKLPFDDLKVAEEFLKS